MVSVAELGTAKKNTWCPGCGNFAILMALKRTIAELGLEPERVVVVTGIGCHGKMGDYVAVNSFHTIHGRVLPLATGIKIANPELEVMGFAGDGDAYAIGIGHLPHAIRRNVDLLYVVHNNKVFGLTTGQYTPTTPKGMKTRSTPFGVPEKPMNPLTFALSLGATFVARGFAGDVEHLTYLFKEGVRHRGFAFIDVLQPCVTFYNTYPYSRERVYRLEDSGHDPSDWEAALAKAREEELTDGERIPIGIFYRSEEPTLLDEMPHLMGEPLVRRELKVDIKRFYEEFM
ncbi:MAG: thiamine pyrophosphate-dependent enzyme [Candidatus Korarchaeota archaeon]|nr:thiamine pyrophosphate-dependent enzyme [Candidatus Korarchaeota archaeon]